MQVLAGHSNLQKHKKTTGRAEFSLRPKCSQEDETPNHFCYKDDQFFVTEKKEQTVEMHILSNMQCNKPIASLPQLQPITRDLGKFEPNK